MKDRLHRLLRNTGADYAEIRIEESLRTSISFTGKALEDCSQSVSYGGNVRALFKGGWGFTTFNSLDELDGKVKKAVEHAMSIGMRRNEELTLTVVDPVVAHVPLDAKRNPADVPIARKVEIVKGYNDIVLGFDKRITTSNSRYGDKIRKLVYANSDGAYVVTESLDLFCAVMPMVQTGAGTFFGRAFNGSSNDFGVVLGLESDVEQGCRDAIAISESQQVKGGSYTVVIDPMLAGVFIHEAFGHLSEGDNVYEDPGLQKVMVFGREFGPKSLNVADTGLDVGTRGHIVYDDEGVPAERTDLIREGKLVGRLHSRETAAKMGERATGNARAIAYSFPPIPRMRNTVIESGDVPFEDMIKETALGIYAIGARGGETNGELFTFSAADGYMIRNGKIAERVRDITLTGNVFDTLKNIDRIGNDYHLRDSGGGCGKGGQFPLPVSHASPHIRIQNVVVGGK
ncbi:MAG: TldD/PmbA family protein [Candidatus Brocadiia bacterium]